MITNTNKQHTILIIALIVVAATYRILPFHIWNVAPIGAIALFGGAKLKNNWQAVFIPLMALFLGDLFLNNVTYKALNPNFTLFYSGAIWIYASFALIALIGIVFLKKISAKNVLLASLAGSVLFFVISNFGVWIGSTMYPHNFAGLLTCYVAAVPFFVNTLAGDLLFSAILFGVYEWTVKGQTTQDNGQRIRS